MLEKVYRVVDEGSGRVIATKVKIAQDYRSRSVGLLNRASLDKEEGLLIKPCNSIHTLFMKFPIDVVYLDKNGRVVKTVNNLVPWRFSSCLIKGYMTLELAKGKISDCSVKVGKHVKIEESKCPD